MKSLQLDSCLIGGELPVDAFRGCVAIPLDRFNLPGEFRRVAHAVFQSSAQHAQFDLCDIEPRAVLGGV